MEDLNDLVLFARVVEHHGFSAASRELGIPKSRLSRRVALLEERMGVRLLQRSSRRLAVTAVGQLFYERCQAVISAGESASEVVQQAVGQPSGALRLSCPISLAQFWLTPMLPTFMRRHPMVNISLFTTNRRIDPIEEGIDVALRVRRPPFDDSSIVAAGSARPRTCWWPAPICLRRRGPPLSLRISRAGRRWRWPRPATASHGPSCARVNPPRRASTPASSRTICTRFAARRWTASASLCCPS